MSIVSLYKKTYNDTLFLLMYNIILNKKNNIIHHLLLTEMKNFLFTTKNEYFVLVNIILFY